MKRLIAGTLLCLTVFSVNAQTVNRTFSLSGFHLYGRCVLPDQTDNTIFYSATATPAGGSTNKLLLTKTDLLGNFQKAVLIDTEIYDHRIFKTRDSGIVVAAHVDSNLYVIKYSKNLVRQWALKTKVGKNQYAGSLYTVGIEKGLDTSTNTEYYYICCASATYLPAFVNTDGGFSVVKVSQNGQMIWNKKYADVNRASGNYAIVADDSYSITAISDNNNKFLIAGTRIEQSYAGQISKTLFFYVYQQKREHLYPI